MTLRTVTSRAFVLAAALAYVSASLSAQAMPSNERGSFRLHKFEQAIGEETYEVTQDGDLVTVTSNFKFKDRFTEVPLTAKLQYGSDLTPRSLELKGKNSPLQSGR
jgi:hypothetical protein